MGFKLYLKKARLELLNAAKAGNVEVVKVLTRIIPDVNGSFKGGDNALIYAAGCGKVDA